MLKQELIMVIAAHFAKNNVEFYPPGPDQELIRGCEIFNSETMNAYEKVSEFLRMREGFEHCFRTTFFTNTLCGSKMLDSRRNVDNSRRRMACLLCLPEALS
jgi:hypothetical protein